MYSTCCIGADVEMNRMFDQYLFKGTESFDLSLSIPDPVQENHASYMSSDQTFHTPSFGDEEFDIPPISLPPSSMASETPNSGQNYNPQGMSHSGMGEQVMTMGSPNMPQSMPHNPDSMNMGGNRMVASPPTSMMGQQGHFPSPGMYLQPIAEGNSHMTSQADQMTSQSFETQPTYTTARPQLLMHPSPTQQGLMPAPGSTLLTTISQSQLTNQLGLQFGLPQRTPSVSGSSPGSNQTSPSQETSEDSDDSTPISQVSYHQMMGALKRPSPEPDNKAAIAKKPKVPKKKKKRDPNEPQKPVSAYALFFRDTQAAIKGQNPNASFGEVSKIVASMWDSLDAEHKNVYKKKTEAAKKEYLKALAAYRASLVSKQSSSEHTESLYSSGPSYGSNSSYSQQQQQQQQQQQPNITSSISSSAVSSTTGLAPLPQQQPLSPLQKKSPLLTSLMEGPQPTQQPSNQQVMMAPATMSQAMPLQQHPQMQVPNPSMGALSSPPQSSQMGQTVTTTSSYPPQSMMQQTNHPPPNAGGQQPLASPQGLSTNQPPNGRPTTCLRNGCQNPAVESPDWDSEYCRMYLPPGWLPGRHLILLPQ